MRKRTGIVALWLVSVGLCIGAPAARAQDRGFGLGVIIGEPTGLSANAWTSNTSALDLAAAWSFSHGDAFHLHGDLVWHRFDLIDVSEGRLPFYYGLGLRLKFNSDQEDDDVRLGLRIPLGLDYLFGGGTPLDTFVEVGPIVDLVPDTDVTLNASIGLRYWFH
jgi:hypothetical protein